MKHELPELPYPRDALEPHISAETLDYHHGKHHRAYVDKLNELLEGSAHADKPLDEIVASAGDGDLFNQAAQAWNHDFYWHCMSPEGGGAPTGRLAEVIDNSFGSFEAFKQSFSREVTGLFGCGWVWLVKTTADTVAIESTKEAMNPTVHGRIVLLTCDVWEHAFYIDYRNDKSSYVDAFWNVVNWPFVESRLHG